MRVRFLRNVIIGGVEYKRGEIYDIDENEVKGLADYYEVVKVETPTAETPKTQAKENVNKKPETKTK
jgi:hypothetical protein